jgi:Arc-like DNA binding domain
MMSSMDKFTVVHTRLPASSRDRLAAHANELGRSLNGEARAWLELGGAMARYASLVDPRAGLAVPDGGELDAVRAEALQVMREAMARALPSFLAPEVALSAFVPISSTNQARPQ